MSDQTVIKELQTQLEKVEKQIEAEWTNIALLENRRRKYQEALDQLRRNQTDMRFCLSCRLPLDRRWLTLHPKTLYCATCQQIHDSTQRRRLSLTADPVTSSLSLSSTTL